MGMSLAFPPETNVNANSNAYGGTPTPNPEDIITSLVPVNLPVTVTTIVDLVPGVPVPVSQELEDTIIDAALPPSLFVTASMTTVSADTVVMTEKISPVPAHRQEDNLIPVPLPVPT